MPKIRLATRLDAPADTVWEALQRSDTLVHVARPLLHIRPTDPPALPELWADDAYRVRLRLFGVLPLGSQTIVVSRPAPQGDRRVLRDDGHGTLVRRWTHVITVTQDGAAARYVDEVSVEAGLLTPVVVAFARLFYAHRQRRWRRLARRLAAGARP